jgi:SAM-dependent methyltransferase
MTESLICPICEAPGLKTFFRSADVPVIDNVFWPSRELAVGCAKGDIELAFCANCECIRNLGVGPGSVDYDLHYENSLHFSPAFQDYAKGLAADLVERYRLRDKTIVEIGCGKGEFLAMLCELGHNRGIGFDPSYANGRGNAAAGAGITYISEFYSVSSAPPACDFICCRHVLEHISAPKQFLSDVRRNAEKTGAGVFFEVPNARFTFQRSGIWDIIYPHAFYFVSGTLRRLFTGCGFRVESVREGFDGQYLSIEATPEGAPDMGAEPEPARCRRYVEPRPARCRGDGESVASEIEKFQQNYQKRVEELAGTLDRLRRSPRPTVLWGAGSKGVAFLNRFKAAAPVDYVVDINPHKQGKFVPGTGQQVIAPEFLKEVRPGAIIIMNPNYRQELQRQVESLGIQAEFISGQ